MPTKNTGQTPNGNAVAFDWAEDWKRLQNQRRHVDAVNYWNMRAPNFDLPGKPSPYVEDFLSLAQIEPGESVLDMGCGTGSIAVPLALDGHEVVAADFSEAMVEQMRGRIDGAGTVGITPLVMAWEDDWRDFGIKEKGFDVAIASRSLSVRDLGQALEKLCGAARRKCCVTCACGYSPRMDKNVLAACGLENLHGRDDQYVANILMDRGYNPAISYIHSTRKDTYDSVDDAAADFGRMIDDLEHLYPAEQIEQARTKLVHWLEDNLIENEDAGSIGERGNMEKPLRLRTLRVVDWAFISWDVSGSDTNAQ